jgi:tRNA modification GTPase
MFSTSDTIVAIATPPGRGGLGVIRISGPDAARIAGDLIGPRTLTPRYATFATLKFQKSPQVASGVRPRIEPSESFSERREASNAKAGDRGVVTRFVAPSSYTGEDVVEISAHGSPVVLNSILRAAIDRGARLAEPGEFTLRAFLNGKLDLIQAEAVADLIDAVTPLQARAAFDQLEGTLTEEIGAIDRALFDIIAKLEASLDFPDEGYHFVAPKEGHESIAAVIARIDTLLAQAARGRLVREGAQVAIVGAPNVGKSSLFNALLNTNRAIVTAIPGTTRDLLTERADIGGLSLALIDTAGVRETSDVVEQEGVSRARDTIGVADLTIVLLDRSRALSHDDQQLLDATAARPRIVAMNKSDLPSAMAESFASPGAIAISAKTGDGLDSLIDAIAAALASNESLRDTPALTNVRHTVLLERAKESLVRACSALESEVSEEFPLLDLQEASAALQEITGKRTSDDLLRHIFERFCIGK